MCLNEGLTVLGERGQDGVFQRSSLRIVNIPSTVAEIFESTFEDCVNLQTVTLQNGTAKICRNAFKNVGLQEMHVPQSLQVIEKEALGVCCRKVYLPDGLQTVSQNVMCNIHVREIVVPSTVVEIEENAFSGH